jgi:hypothetical protein
MRLGKVLDPSSPFRKYEMVSSLNSNYGETSSVGGQRGRMPNKRCILLLDKGTVDLFPRNGSMNDQGKIPRYRACPYDEASNRAFDH